MSAPATEGAPDPALAEIFKQSRRTRLAYALALLAQDGMSLDEFQAKHPGVDVAESLRDPALADEVERIAALPSVRQIVLEIQTTRAADESLRLLNKKLAEPDCTVRQAQDIAETVVKVGSFIDRRRTENPTSGRDREKRHLSACMGNGKLTTPLGRTNIELPGLIQENFHRLARALCCIDEDECDVVRRALARCPGLGILNITLEGF